MKQRALPWILVGGLAVLVAAAVAGFEWLWVRSLLQWKTPILVSAAIGTHLWSRSRSSIAVASLHLIAIESAITDLMATGSWATGWASLTAPGLWLTAGPSLAALVLSTAFGVSRLMRETSGLKRTWPLAVLSGLIGTALGRHPGPIVAWALIGMGIAFLALIWILDLQRAWLDRRIPALAYPHGFHWMLAGWVLAASALLSRVVFHAMPHVPDEVAYWFQAKYFAAGRLWLPSPPEWPAFSLAHTLNVDGRWFSIFPPGWPAVLSGGFLVGVPTLVNPLLAGATVIVLYRLLTRIYGSETANTACLLLAASPAFLLMSAGLMSHPLSLLLAVVAVSALHHALTNRAMGSAALAGMAMALLMLTRPFEGALITAALGLVFVFRTHWRSFRGVLAVLAFAAASVAGPVLILVYQHFLTGDAWRDPISMYFDSTYYAGGNRLGFGASIANYGWANDLLPGYGPIEGVAHLQINAQLINSELFAWPIGSLAALALYAIWRRRLRVADDAWFIAVLIAPIAGHFFYWYSGADYGARYWYQILVPCAVLSARALSAPGVPRPALTSAAAVGCVIAVFVFLPWRAVTKYVGYRGMGDSVQRLASACDFGGGLVLVRDASASTQAPIYASAAALNSAGFPSDDPVFAREMSPEATARIQAALGPRPVWVISVPVDPRGDARILVRPAGAPSAASAPCQVTGEGPGLRR